MKHCNAGTKYYANVTGHIHKLNKTLPPQLLQHVTGD